MWNVYKLVYKAISPIHIGWHTLGYIKLTKYYIPGRNIWAAFTENIVHSIQINNNDLNNVYRDVGDILKKDILISYFYPCTDPEIPLLPNYTEKGLMIGDFPKYRFEKLFVKSYGQTAILPENNTAENETLHESEYIAPFTDVNNEMKKVFFIGYIFLKQQTIDLKYNKLCWYSDDTGYIKLREAISEIFVGGDRKYGWGKLSLDLEKTTEVKEDHKLFKNYKLTLNNDNYPILEINNNSNIPAHLPFNNNLKLKGDLEPLIGREFKANKESNEIDKDSNQCMGAGQEIKAYHNSDKVFWMPGSVLLEEKKTTLKIGQYGILKEVNEK